MIKQKSNTEKEKESTRGKKRYLERKALEREADNAIKEFDREENIENSRDERPTNRRDGE